MKLKNQNQIMSSVLHAVNKLGQGILGNSAFCFMFQCKKILVWEVQMCIHICDMLNLSCTNEITLFLVYSLINNIICL